MQIISIKRMWIIVLCAFLWLAGGCGRTEQEESESTREEMTTAEAFAESSSERVPIQSSVTQAQSAGTQAPPATAEIPLQADPLVTGDITEENLEQICRILTESGLSHTDVFAEWVRNTASVAKEETDVSGFQDASCRLTLMLLAGDLIHSESTEEAYAGTYLMFDMEAIENQEAFALLQDKKTLFTTLFGETEIPEERFEQVLGEKWEKHKISVESEKCAVISLVFKSYEEDTAFVGHTGILVDCRDRADVSTDYIFVEKIAFGDPFRVTLVKDEADLLEMLSGRSDYRTEEGDPAPVVYRNGSLIGRLDVK